MKLRYLKLFSIVCLFLALFNLPYGYYSFLRIVVFATAAFTFFSEIENGHHGDAFTIAMIGVVYNPFVPLHLNFTLWFLIDICIIGIFYCSVNKEEKNATEESTHSKKESVLTDTLTTSFLHLHYNNEYNYRIVNSRKTFQKNLKNLYNSTDIEGDLFLNVFLEIVKEPVIDDMILIGTDSVHIGTIPHDDTTSFISYLEEKNIQDEKIICKAKISQIPEFITDKGFKGYIYEISLDMPLLDLNEMELSSRKFKKGEKPKQVDKRTKAARMILNSKL